MRGGSHTYSFLNAASERCWVNFTFKTQQGIETLSDAEAATLVGQGRESHHRDLHENIENGNFPRWTMFVQIMSEAQAAKHRHSPFDLIGLFDRLRLELAWHAPGHAAAVKASLLHILVAILRLECQGTAQLKRGSSNDARLIARFPEQVEARFRSHVPVGTYASALGVKTRVVTRKMAWTASR